MTKNISCRPKISIISIDYNGLELTCKMIESLEEKIDFPLEVIIVDNASRTDNAAEIKRRYPFVKTIRSRENLGFAGGNNLGLKEATGDYLFFLNNDTEVLSGDITALCKALDEDPSLGIVCPKIKFTDGTIQFAGYTEMKGISLANDLVGFCKKDDGTYDSPALSYYAHGAAMMVKREALEEVGPMPECYFLYFEELDWSLMFRRKGWKIKYIPDFSIMHKESASVGQESPLRHYYMTRNRQIFALRNRKGIQKVLSIMYTRYLSSTKRTLKAALGKRWDIVKAIAKGNRDFLKIILCSK